MERINRKKLLTMPIHIVSSRYGLPGLRELLSAEIEESERAEAFTDAERARIARAERLGSLLHAQDRRVSEPYANHLLRVAIRIIRRYQVSDTDVICAALLHDSVEDHPLDLAALATDAERERGPVPAALAVLERAFNPRVAELVGAVTNPAWDPARDAHTQYREHVAASLEHRPWARIVKLSDFTDNGVGLIHTEDEAMERRLAGKYAPLVPLMRDLAARPDTPLTDAVKAYIDDQLATAAERFTAILAEDAGNRPAIATV
ncbi:HD domain-containing protein [Actinospica durhamensis]|uniref:HD domain-containing protein n=1 Tax=Actinospica durhamensis TaxID=1508375 RepID=A0A941IUN5_9ACTN|nr:HD domain-containing protein [Actinospica durhamensis]MBR7835796.1 HD domain-containing protein [Actinospica durhamensis]